MGGYDPYGFFTVLEKDLANIGFISNDNGRSFGRRHKLLGIDIYNRLIAGGIKDKDAKDWTKAIAGVFGALKKAEKDKPLAELEIEQLVYVSPAEHRRSTH